MVEYKPFMRDSLPSGTKVNLRACMYSTVFNLPLVIAAVYGIIYIINETSSNLWILLLALLALIMGLIVQVIGFRDGYLHFSLAWRLNQEGVTTTGTIIDRWSEEDDMAFFTGTRSYIAVEYLNKYRVKEEVLFEYRRLKIDQHVLVRYLPDNPLKFRIERKR